MSEKNNFIVSISTSTSTEGEKVQSDKMDAKDDADKNSAPNVHLPDALQNEIQLNRIEKSEGERPTGIIVVPESELDSNKTKIKKKTGGLEKNFKLDITDHVMKDKIAMTDRPEHMDKQEMTDEEDSSPNESKATSDNTLPLIKQNIRPLTQRVRKIVKRSSSADRIMDIEMRVGKSATSQPIPSTEVEEVVTELETVEEALPRHKSSVNLSRTLSRVSSRVSRISRSVRQLVCCGVTMEASSDDKLPARPGHAI